MFRNAFALIVSLGLALPGHAASRAELFGLEDTLRDDPQRATVPTQIQDAWAYVQKLLRVDASAPGPAIYIYPFVLKQEPARLVALQRKFVAVLPPAFAARFTSDAHLENYLSMAHGYTYAEKVFEPGDRDIGRVIQINPVSTFFAPDIDGHGLGIYSATHEMIHYALGLKKIPSEFHHCAMIPWLKARAPEQVLANSELRIICNHEILQIHERDGAAAAEAFEHETQKISATFSAL